MVATLKLPFIWRAFKTNGTARRHDFGERASPPLRVHLRNSSPGVGSVRRERQRA